MDIQSQLKDKNIYFPLMYYGLNDLATGWDVKTIVDNRELFHDLLSSTRIIDIQSKEDYINYLICIKIGKLKEIVTNILLDENKKIINDLSIIADKAICEINEGQIVRFINSNYHDLMKSDADNYDVKEITLGYISRYRSGISCDVFTHISKNCGYLYIDRFAEFADVLEKHPDLFERVFEDYNFDELGLKRVFDVWGSILRKKESNLKHIVKKYNEVLFNNITSTVDDPIEDVYTLNNRVNQYYDFLRTQHDAKAIQLYEIKKAVNAKCNAEIRNNGNVFTTELPIGEIIKRWKECETKELKLLLLTHNRKDQGKLLSSLSFETTEKGLLDFVQSNIPTDGYFSSSHLMTLSSIETVSKATLIGLLYDDETRNELCNLLSSSIATVFSAAHVKENEIINEINALLVSMNLVQQYKNVETVKYSVNYGFCMYMCALMEKVLKAVYFDQVSSETYVKLDVTLKELINESNNYMNVIFDNNHIKNLNYFLLKDGQNKIGRNIRNSLAHLSEIAISDVTYDLCMTVLWLLIDIVNSIILFYSEKNDGKIEFVIFSGE